MAKVNSELRVLCCIVIASFIAVGAILGVLCYMDDGKPVFQLHIEWKSEYELEREARKESPCGPTAFSEESTKQYDVLNSEYPLAMKNNLRSPGDTGRISKTTDEPRIWASHGSGWDLYVQFTSWPAEREVSSLDWAMRWEAATECLSIKEPDNQDMFEIDEIALQAFWERVFACYLPYAHDTPRELLETVEKRQWKLLQSTIYLKKYSLISYNTDWHEIALREHYRDIVLGVPGFGLFLENFPRDKGHLVKSLTIAIDPSVFCEDFDPAENYEELVFHNQNGLGKVGADMEIHGAFGYQDRFLLRRSERFPKHASTWKLIPGGVIKTVRHHRIYAKSSPESSRDYIICDYGFAECALRYLARRCLIQAQTPIPVPILILGPRRLEGRKACYVCTQFMGKRYGWTDYYINRPEARTLIAEYLSQLDHSFSFPRIKRLWLLDLQREDSRHRSMYSAYNRRDIIRNKTWTIPYHPVKGHDDGSLLYLTRMPDNTEVLAEKWVIESLAEEKIWTETLAGARIPSALLAGQDDLAFTLRTEKPVPTMSVSAYRSLAPYSTCCLWHNEEKTGVRLLSAIESDGVLERHPVIELTPPGWRRQIYDAFSSSLERDGLFMTPLQ
ncbi:hypothetical protein AOR_1_1394144 [Paecilomyces variotii No. 5]|uniref:Uncharacterized protein n=1 Tax=Byssochlamys spectabilis (strain No. 5 / NBRC 109023) TaxID=1356009 RepID=V5G362_BYSSN|nr:hypothetical protein AOR_1_1394144 [Paecilomyces variotii No. 5]